MRRLLIPISLVLALLAAGCGGGGGEALSKQDYQQRLNDTGTSLSESSQGFSDDVSKALSGDEAAADTAADEVHAFQERLRKTADELDSVEPPADAAAAHEDLVAGLRAYADDLDGIYDALHDGDIDAVKAGLAGFGTLESVKQLDRAGKRLKELGYTFETS